MSYSIYIGEAVLEYNGNIDQAVKAEGGLPEDIKLRVNMMSHPDAPNFIGDVCTLNTNVRYPGYTQWEDFLIDVGLHSLFFDKQKGLMRHPGIKRLLPEHLEVIKTAIKDYKEKHSGETRILGWPDEPDYIWKNSESHRIFWDVIVPKTHDIYLPRLIWLEWWIAWALRYCRYPAIFNWTEVVF